MPQTSLVKYAGALRTTAVHLQSGTIIETDAPTDNNGRGERFSPTDLVATALASCMMTIMGIQAQRQGLNIEGATCEVEKIMAASPRRISEIRVAVRMPDGTDFTEEARAALEHAALTCPVFESLHPDCKKSVRFHWPRLDNA